MQSFEPREFIAQGDRVVVLGDYSWKAEDIGRAFALELGARGDLEGRDVG